MKKALFITLFGCMATFVFGQTEARRFSYSTTIGTGIAMSSPAKTPISWHVLGYYNLSPRWAVGAGTGISVYEKVLLPLFADAKFRIIRPRMFTPYLECGVGYSFALAKASRGGFFLAPSVGVEYAVSKSAKLLFGLGYELQSLQRVKRYQDTDFLSEFQERLRHNSITFKVGVIF